MSMEHCWNDIDGGGPKYSEINQFQRHFPTTNLTRTDLRSKPGLSVEMPVNNDLSHDTVSVSFCTSTVNRVSASGSGSFIPRRSHEHGQTKHTSWHHECQKAARFALTFVCFFCSQFIPVSNNFTLLILTKF